MHENVATISAPAITERKKAFSIIGLQAATTLLVVLVWLVFGGTTLGLGAMFGGLIYLIPTLLLTWIVFAFKSNNARQLALLLFGGEIAKLIVSALAIALVILSFPEFLWSTLTGFLGAQVGYWLSPFINRKIIRKERCCS